MEILIDKHCNTECMFEIVDEFPLGYTIWNIGTNIKDGYLPLVRLGGHDGCQVDTTCMKAMKVKDAQVILAAIGWGQNTIKEMEDFIEKNKDSKTKSTIDHIERLKDALKVMYKINGIKNLLY